MQEIQLPSGEKIREVFAGFATKADLNAAMDKRLAEHKASGATLVKREKIGRNAPCPCNSGKKFKRCCIQKFEAGIASVVMVL